MGVCRFFALPLEAKKAAKRSQDNSMGYFNDEYTKQKMDLKEGFDFRHVQVGWKWGVRGLLQVVTCTTGQSLR